MVTLRDHLLFLGHFFWPFGSVILILSQGQDKSGLFK